MTFNREEVAQLLAAVHRRCCICHRFCGVKMETDHIVPLADGGGDDIGNALPVCFDCHAEIHSYNTSHPRGRRFTTDELLEHKARWLSLCQHQPGLFASPPSQNEAGPLQALVDELEFNRVVADQHAADGHRGALFETDQFQRALATGSLSILGEAVKNPIFLA